MKSRTIIAIGLSIFLFCCEEPDSQSQKPDEEEPAGEEEIDPEELVLSYDLELDCQQEQGGDGEELIEISDLAFHRFASDIDGTRLVGCLHNHSDQEIEGLHQRYRVVDNGNALRAGGGGLHADPIAPGESASFMMGVFGNQSIMEQGQTLDYEIVDIKADGLDRAEFDQRPTVAREFTDRPTHPMERHCRKVEPDAGTGEVWISIAALEQLPEPGRQDFRVIGCITNRGDEPVGEEEPFRHDSIRKVLVTRANTTKEGDDLQGSISDLYMEAALEPGETRFFVSEFTRDDRAEELYLQPMRREFGETPADYDFVTMGSITQVH